MEYKDFISRIRAAEKRERQRKLSGERENFVPFQLWTKVARGIEDPMEVDKAARNKLYQDYQSDMIRMGFFEWQRATTCGVSPWYDLFG